MIGKALAHYEILGLLGKGGMGEVYRARDTKLDREVAIKVLPREMSGDPERLARFQREARTLASLQHPNIASIYGFEETPDARFLVMELVEGDDLAARLSQGRVSVQETLRIAHELAVGLAAAHERNVVHRDLKPANIKFDRDGAVKILDFGLARAYIGDAETQQDIEISPTITAAMTQAGTILGTAAYMSPEQAKGRPLDQRADIWSFGCVLYECLTGCAPFDGETVTDVLASIVLKEPDWSILSPDTPASLRRVLRLCLRKDRAQRLRSIQDVRLLLDDGEHDEADSSAVSREPSAARPLSRRVAVALVPIAFLLLLALGIRLTGWGQPEPGLMLRSVTPLTDLPGEQFDPHLSPDGRQLIFCSRGDRNDFDIFLQRVGGENAINLTPNSYADDVQPAFSPSGDRIVFRSNRDGGGLFVMGATGESPRRVSEEGFDPAWSPDGTKIVYTEELVRAATSRAGIANLWILDLDTGTSTRLDDIDATGPSWSPSGARIAFWTHMETVQGQRDLWTIAADGSEAPVPVFIDSHTDWDPVWSLDGRHLYFLSDRGGLPDVWRIAIDEKSGKVKGEPERVTGGVSPITQLSVSVEGRLAVNHQRSRCSVVRSTFDPQTLRTTGSFETILSSNFAVSQLSLSNDGKRLAYGEEKQGENILIMNSDGTERRRVTGGEGRNRGPCFSPDDEWITFYSNASGSYEIWAVRTDGTDLRQLTDSPGIDVSGSEWTPDGTLFATVQDPQWVVAELLLPDEGLSGVTGPVAYRKFENTTTLSPNWSPNGRYGATTLDGHIVILERTGDALPIVARTQRLVHPTTNTEPVFIDDRWVVAWDHGEQHAFAFDVFEGTERILDDLPGPGSYLFTSDARMVYATIEENDSDLWLVQVAAE